jgi:hypothetical protein
MPAVDSPYSAAGPVFGTVWPNRMEVEVTPGAEAPLDDDELPLPLLPQAARARAKAEDMASTPARRASRPDVSVIGRGNIRPPLFAYALNSMSRAIRIGLLIKTGPLRDSRR